MRTKKSLPSINRYLKFKIKSFKSQVDQSLFSPPLKDFFKLRQGEGLLGDTAYLTDTLYPVGLVQNLRVFYASFIHFFPHYGPHLHKKDEKKVVQSTLSKTDTFGTGTKCPPQRDVRLIKSQIKGIKKGRDQLQVSVKRESTVKQYTLLSIFYRKTELQFAYKSK